MECLASAIFFGEAFVFVVVGIELSMSGDGQAPALRSPSLRPPVTPTAQAELRSRLPGSAAPCSASLFLTRAVPLCSPRAVRVLGQPWTGLPLWGLGACCPEEHHSGQGLPQKHGPFWAESANLVP